MNSLIFFIFSILFHVNLLLSAEVSRCHRRCQPFICGKLGKICFPLRNITHRDCGLYTVNCSEPIQKIQLKDGGHWYPIVKVITKADFIHVLFNHSVYINNAELIKNMNSQLCHQSAESFSLPVSSTISNVSALNSSILFNCSHNLDIPSSTDYDYTVCPDYNVHYYQKNKCSKHETPVHFKQCSSFQLLTDHLQVYVNHDCVNCFFVNGGQFKINSTNQLYCHDKQEELDGRSKAPLESNDSKERGNKKLGLKLGLGIGCLALLLCPLMFLLWRRYYKRKHTCSSAVSRNTSDLEGGSIYLGIPVLSYIDLEEATNNFDSTRELGDGGFGTVYHGKLKDGREVAVKRLYEHNCKRLQHFMNEIVILAHLRHKYLVSLYGCTSRHSRELLLVYEYVPNGTVADHLHGDRAKNGSLTWPIRMSIAIETATALAYLHASDVIHRDVKTNNILLDNNFCVKVADFGLSRLFPNNVTHISTAPQGTPGYVDPEYLQCYQLTSKSDVYSFGVVLVELISSKPAVDITRHTHEINLANLAINKIQKCAINELVDPSLGAETDNEVRRKIIAVAELAFQCLQEDKENRPSMNEVLEDLKRISGKIEPDDQTVNGEGPFDRVMSRSCVQAQSSPDGDEVVDLLHSKKPQTSPISVTRKWSSSSSTTPDVGS